MQGDFDPGSPSKMMLSLNMKGGGWVCRRAGMPRGGGAVLTVPWAAQMPCVTKRDSKALAAPLPCTVISTTSSPASTASDLTVSFASPTSFLSHMLAINSKLTFYAITVIY